MLKTNLYAMKSIIQNACVLGLLFIVTFANAQEKTMNTDNKKNTERELVSKNKIMLIPFENKMYLSEIDAKINQESKLSAKQIKALMRDGLNEQLYKKLKGTMSVIDMLEDTSKTQKDLGNIYQYLAYQYQRTPNQEKYKAPSNEKESKNVNKGQLTVETNGDSRFMNAKLKNSTLVPYLTGKYKTNLYLFINELDIKSFNSIPGDFNSDSNRKIIVHYTIYTFDAKEINSGIAEITMPIYVNNPAKIINTYFSQAADLIAQRLNKALSVN
jgi:hypothetical protein